MKKIGYRYPQGKMKALTMSYDDGTIHDRRLVEIFNAHGIKGTFHLNSGTFENSGKIDPCEVALNERGIRTAKGLPFRIGSLGTVLKNRKYIGE